MHVIGFRQIKQGVVNSCSSWDFLDLNTFDNQLDQNFGMLDQIRRNPEPFNVENGFIISQKSTVICDRRSGLLRKCKFYAGEIIV